ncbi:hypothetical protein [Mucilaginibacter lacusdianchii]|uniref:hypothetical protein n=1 Tax=Mucilaginibacter lacusdianchii TaxID=2684211 RepID=UPI00131E318F|nr:hypothetical protein [Mucilaginibacter sp. JXJ CY 39]
MKKLLLALFVLFSTFTLSGCQLIGDVFKGGFIFGIILAVIIGLIIWALSSFSSENLVKNKPMVK